jgi:hypothetical protein
MRQLTGITTRAKNHRPVEFVCPRCGVDRAGAVVELQRWYCVLGRGVMPLAKLGERVECGDCSYRAGLAVLDVPTAAMLAQRLEQAMRSAAATMVRAAFHDGGRSVDIDVIDEVIDVLRSNGYDYDEAVLQADLTATNDIETLAFVRLIADELTAYGKQSFVHKMLAIAVADGPVTSSEQRAISRIGVALGMVPPHLNGVLRSVAHQYQTAAA